MTTIDPATHVALLETAAPGVQRTCRECRWSECRFKVTRVRSFIIAYREARKWGDDPGEYIRDSIKPSRRVGEDESRETTDALIRGTKPTDRLWHIDVKVSLEQARDVGGLALESWNADRVAEWLCQRACEASR